jgi:ferritin-like protein
MSNTGFHESADELSDLTKNMHRAIRSLMEELEAVDWYNQRANATQDESLRAVLEHNRDEEKEHAAMAIEWLRRRDSVLDEHLRTYLFTSGSIVGMEHEAESGDDGGGSGTDSSGSLGIGSLKGTR